MTDNTNTKKVGFFSKIKKFLVETKSEMKKVTWPDRKKLINNTVIILVFIAVITVILYLLDTGFAALFSLVTPYL